MPPGHLHPVEVDWPAAKASANLQLAEAFEDVNQINGAATLQAGFMREGVERRLGPAGVGIHVRGDDQQQRAGRTREDLLEEPTCATVEIDMSMLSLTLV